MRPKPAPTDAGNATDLRAEFQTLHQKLEGDIRAFARSRCGDEHAAEDITEEAFLRLWKKRQCGEAVPSPLAWLLRVARNLAEDRRKSAFRRHGTQPPEVMNGVREKPPESPEPNEGKQRRLEALAALPDDDRSLLTDLYINRRCRADLAAERGVSERALKRRLEKVRAKLRKDTGYSAPGVKRKPGESRARRRRAAS